VNNWDSEPKAEKRRLDVTHPSQWYVSLVHRAAVRHLVISAIVLIALSFCAFSVIGQTVVRVGFYENPPKLYTDEAGRITGFFPEILAVIAEQEGWKLEYVPGTWGENLIRLEAGEIDLMPDVAYSEERAEIYGFSQEPLFVNWGVIYAPSDSVLLSIPDLAGKRIAVMAGSIHTDGTQGIKALLAQFDIQSTFVEVDSYEGAFELLQSRDVDAGVVNRLFGLQNAERFNVTETQIVFNPRELRFAYPKGSEGGFLLAERIDAHIRSMKADADSIYHRSVALYLLGESPGGRTHLPHWLLVLLGAAAAVIASAAIFIIRLRHRHRRLGEVLSATEIRLDAMFENAAVGFAIEDIESKKFSRVNPRFCEMLGYSESELLQLCVDDVVHSQDLERDAPAFSDVIEGRTPELLVEERFTRKDRAEIWVSVFLSVVRGPDGKPTYWIGVMQDITRRKNQEYELEQHREHLEELVAQRTQELTASEERLRVTFDKSPLGIMRIDRTGTIATCNDRLGEIFGVPQKDCVGCNLLKVVVNPEMRRAIQSALAGELASYEGIHTCAGSEKETPFVHILFNPVLPGASASEVIATVEDVSERKESERELQAFNEVMLKREERIIELKEQVNKLAIELGQPIPYEPVWEADEGTET
jgi:PAS domain S-box-containing protein